MKRRQARKARGQESGLYLVEFAMVAGVFFLMLFGAIEVARRDGYVLYSVPTR